MRGKTWTKKEMNYLYLNWGFFTIKQFAKKFNRTETAILIKAKRMKLGSPYKNISRFSARQVADIMGVDLHAVTDYWIKKCGLKSSKKPYRNRSFCLIEYDNLISWLEHNQDKWDSRRITKDIFLLKPLWLRAKKEKDNKLPKSRYKKWTHEEDNKLRFLYYKKKMNFYQISRILGRSFSGIEHRLLRLLKKDLVSINR